MRCPGCQFVSSDTWDICPKCFIDLRPHKQAAGLQVHNPAAVYEDLAVRAGAAPELIRKAQSSTQSKSFFGGLFHKPEHAVELQVSASAQESIPPASASSIVAAVLNASRAETEKLERVSKEIPRGDPALDRLQKVEVPLQEPKHAVTPRSDQTIVVSAFEPMSEILQTGAVPGAVVNSGHLEMGNLFENTFTELSGMQDESAVEFTSEHLLGTEADKLTVALFDFAYEVVQDPARENQIAEKITTSDERRVEAQDLTQQLAQVERRLSLPVFGLKSLQARAASARQRESAEPVVEWQLAGPGPQLLSFLIDTLAIFLMSGVLALFLYSLTDAELFSRLLKISDLAKPDVISLITLAAALSIALLVLYPMGCLSLFRRTLGHYFCNLRIVTELGRHIRASHLLVRSMSLPLSCMCFGYIPVLFKGRSLHDALARTKVCHDRNS